MEPPSPAFPEAILGEDDRATTMHSSSSGLMVAERFECREVLGRGGAGVVHRAYDHTLDRELALKELSAAFGMDHASTARFRQEARALARLNHPGIVQIHDLIESHGRLWLVMEFVGGGDLESFLRQEAPLDIDHILELGVGLADALVSAHEQGVVHRDLKPLNVLLADSHTPKITDFGLAKLSEGSPNTLQGVIIGSPHYMSPEQCDGAAIDHRSDIYSLGVMLHEMIAGAPPFEGEPRSILAQHLQKAPPPLPRERHDGTTPPRLIELVASMLDKSPDSRPQTMEQVRAGLISASSVLAH